MKKLVLLLALVSIFTIHKSTYAGVLSFIGEIPGIGAIHNGVKNTLLRVFAPGTDPQQDTDAQQQVK